MYTKQGKWVAEFGGKQLVAVQCPVNKKCKERFPWKKRDDLGTYNRAEYEKHLREVHKIFLPKPIHIFGH